MPPKQAPFWRGGGGTSQAEGGGEGKGGSISASLLTCPGKLLQVGFFAKLQGDAGW